MEVLCKLGQAISAMVIIGSAFRMIWVEMEEDRKRAIQRARRLERMRRERLAREHTREFRNKVIELERIRNASYR